MKFEAHPLVVAVALGLLSPAALADDDDTDEADRATVGCTELLTSDESTYDFGDAPDPEAFHRVEIAWLKRQ